MAVTRLAIVILAGAFLGGALAYAQQPPSAAALLDEAKAEAAKDHRDIVVIFHASWCGWCKQLDKFIGSPDVTPIVGKYFVQARITVQERDEMKALNNPGGEQLMTRLGGIGGLPFFAFLNGQGALLVNSVRPGGENIGHPVAPEEIDWFMTMLRKAVPSMTPQEMAPLETWLRAQKK